MLSFQFSLSKGSKRGNPIYFCLHCKIVLAKADKHLHINISLDPVFTSFTDTDENERTSSIKACSFVKQKDTGQDESGAGQGKKEGDEDEREGEQNRISIMPLLSNTKTD